MEIKYIIILSSLEISYLFILRTLKEYIYMCEIFSVNVYLQA